MNAVLRATRFKGGNALFSFRKTRLFKGEVKTTTMPEIIQYSPELVGYDPALEAVFPVQEMIGVMRRTGAFYRALNKPYYRESSPTRRFHYMFANKNLKSYDEETGEIVLEFFGGKREIRVTPHKGGWKFVQKSSFLRDRYADRIEDENELEAFATHQTFLRQAYAGELSSVIPYVYQEGETLYNNSWFNKTHWSLPQDVTIGKHEFRWELINGSSSWKVAKDENDNDIMAAATWQGGQYLDLDLASKIEVIPADKAAYLGDGVFTYNPEEKFSRMRVSVWFSKWDNRRFTINLI